MIATNQTIIVIPVIVEPIEVQNPAVVIPVDNRDVEITVRVTQNMQNIVHTTTP